MQGLLRAGLLLTLLLSFAAPLEAKDTLSILVPTQAGGDSDIYARAVARHIGTYLPETEKVIVQNIPGAGGGKLCRYLLEVAGNDKVAILSPGIGATLLGDSSHKDCALERLVDLGAGNEGGRMFLFRKAVGVERWEDLANLSGKTLFVASTARASFTVLMAKSLLNAYGIVMQNPGVYAGANDTLLAARRGEADVAMQFTADYLRSPKEGMTAVCAFGLIEDKRITRNPATPEMPTCAELAERRLGAASAEQELMNAVTKVSLLGNPFFAPPGFPEEKAALLRAALSDVHRDPAYLADAAKVGASTSFVDAREYRARREEIVKELGQAQIGRIIDSVLAK